MRIVTYFILVSLIFFRCTYDVDLKPVDNTLLFTDGNSKVWLIESGVKSRGISNVDFHQKEMIIFYVSGKCYIQKVSEFTITKPRIFDFTRKEIQGKEYLFLSNKHKKVKYEITKMTNDVINLTEKNRSEDDHIFELTPFPEY